MNGVLITNITKRFRSVVAVDDLSVSIPRGSIYGFLGPNGAGKTTTIRMIMRILFPDSGSISFPESFTLGYLPEERGLYRKMTVEQVLTYIGHLHGMKTSDLTKAICCWLERMELTRWAKNRVEELSKGMQQKIQFITAVLYDPDILILDEPFSGLDPVNLEFIKQVMMEKHNTGKTIIFSTHIMEHAEQLCDFILLINQGKKVIDGRIDEIKSRYSTNTVIAKIEGNADFLNDLPMVESIRKNGEATEINLRQNDQDQLLLNAMVGRVKIRAFEVKRPSLHEIFVNLVGNHHDYTVRT